MLDVVLPLASTAPPGPGQTGQIFGQMLVVLLLVWGAYKCIAIARRPTTSTKAAMALLLVLLAWLGAVASQMLPEHPVWNILKRVSAFGLMVLLVVGFMLAILGLLDIRRSAGALIQGRRQAWSALVIGGIFLVSIAVGAGIGIVREMRGTLASGPSATEPQVFHELNFRFDAPGAPWATLEVTALNPDATLGFLRTRPQILFMMIAEAVGPAMELTVEGLADMAEANLRSGSSSYEKVSEEVYSIGGLEGIRMVSYARTGGRAFQWVHWMYERNGFVYQLIMWCERDRRTLESLLEEADALMGHFHLLDANRVAVSPDGEPFATYRSPTYGYSIDLRDTAWLRWSTVGEELPGADVGGLWGSSGAFAVLPVDLSGLEVDFEPLVAALLAQMDLSFPDKAIAPPVAVQRAGMEGVRLEYDRNVEGTNYEYVIHVLKDPTRGFLHAVWRLAGSEMPVDLLQPTLDAMVVTPRHPSPDGEGAWPTDHTDMQGLILNDIGLWYLQRANYERSIVVLEAASGRRPHDAVIFMNWLSALNAGGRVESALRLLEHHGRRFEQDLSVRAWHPFLLGQVGRTAEALDEYRELFQRGYRDEEDLLHYSRLLRESGHAAEAVRVIDELHRDQPRSIDLFGEMVAAHFEMDQHDQVVELCESMLESGRREAALHFWKGRSEYALGWFRDAKTSMETALHENPTHGAAGEFLDQIAGLLGQGENALLRQPVRPVSIPEDLTRSGAAGRCEAADHGACYLHSITAVEHDDSTYRITNVRRIHIDDRKGVTRFKTIRVPFDPLLEAIHVDRLRVLDASGSELATGNIDEYYVLDDTSGGVASQDKVAFLPVPGLEPGVTVDLQISRSWLRPPQEIPFRAHLFSHLVPVRRAVFLFRGDAERLAHRSSGVGRPESRNGMLIWKVDGPPTVRFEPLGEPVERYLPTVWIADATATWVDVATEYLDDIRDVLEPDAEAARIEADVAPGVRGLAGVKALATHVQELLTYEAIEFGRRAWHPNSPSQIVRKRSGDCKDHALLLYHLLQKRGVRANLALVRVSGDVQPELPSLDQFDHMVVYLPSDDGDRFIDSTDKGHDIVGLPPMGLGDTWALVLDPEAPVLERIAPFPAEGSEIDSSRDVRLEADGDLHVRETLTLTDYAAAWLRYPLRDLSDSDARLWVQSRLSESQSTAELQSLELIGLNTPAQPLQIEMEYVLSDSLVPDDGRMTGKLPAIWERLHLQPQPLDRRFTPFAVRYPFQVRSRVRAEAAEGLRLAGGEEVALEDDGPFASWRVLTQRGERVLEIEFEFLLKGGNHPAAAYDDYVEAVNGPLMQLQQGVVISRR